MFHNIIGQKWLTRSQKEANVFNKTCEAPLVSYPEPKPCHHVQVKLLIKEKMASPPH